MILTRDGKEVIAIYKQNGDEVDEVKDANGRLVYTNTREITGTLPLSFSSRGKPLTDYHISGNTVQDGTPTPDAPVDVVGCGGLEENVAIINNRSDTVTNWYYTDVRLSNELPAGTYTISFTMDSKTWDATASSLGRGNRTAYQADVLQYQIPYAPANINKTITLNSNACIWARFLRSATPATFSYSVSKIAIVSGNKPYGQYKLPLTVNGTEYPIYLGEAQTTRKIKKLVLTGEENWTYRSGAPANVFFMYLPTAKTGEVAMSNAYPYYSGTDFVDMNDKEFAIIRSNLVIRNSDYQYESQFKAYLAAQYAAGTPVTVWYVLAVPETSVVNEPLMKIGNYADTITMAQAGVTIPTVSGTNVLDMLSPVKPSEVYIKGKGIRAIA